MRRTTIIQKTGGGSLPSYTWANRPSAIAGQRAFFSDIGGGVELTFDGSIWRASSAVNIGGMQASIYQPSSGSISNNGALTLTTGIPYTFSSGVYFYFPVNAIFAGSAAGLYYVIMSSATVGVVYNNTYTSGTPKFIASPTPFVTTGPGAYTQTTAADITLASYNLPANLLKNFGTCEFETVFFNNNSAGNKTRRISISGANINSLTNSTVVFSRDNSLITYVNNNEILRGQWLAGYNSSGVLAINTPNLASDVTISFVGQIAIATDFIGMHQASIILK